MPAYMMQIDVIPVTKNGKVDRRALPDIEISVSKEYVAPRNDVEEMVADIWAQIFKVEKISVCDSFLDIGGHSLLAMNLINLINQEMGTEITLAQFFASSMTIEDMAIMVEESLLSGLSDEELMDLV